MENGLLISNESEEDTQKDKFLTFLIGEETYGLDIHYVMEIVGLQPITELPELPDFMKGIINLRGRIVPVMDVRIRFRKENRAYHDRTCIIIVHSGAVTLGLIVDEVAEVTTIPEQDIVMPPSLQGVAANRFMKAIGKVGEQVKLLLDCDRLVNGATVAEWDALTAQA